MTARSMPPPTLSGTRAALRDFDSNPTRAGRELRDAFYTDSGRFLAALLEESALDASHRGVRYAMLLLLHNDVLVPAILDSSVTTFPQALRLTRNMLKVDRGFINSMLRGLLLNSDLEKQPARTLRILDIVRECIDHLGDWRLIVRLHEVGDAQARIKCAGLIAQYRFENPAGLERFCRAAPRVRANIVEILWNVDRSRASALLHAASLDPSNRVAGNAWLALYADGNVQSLAGIAAMLESPDPMKRKTAIWVVGQSRDGRFARRLLEASQSDMPDIRTAALGGLSKLDPVACKDSDSETPDQAGPDVSFVSATAGEETELWLRVTGPDGEFLPGIRPVDFFVWAGDEFLLDYSIEESKGADSLALGIVFPAGSQVLTRAFRDAIGTKAAGHCWAWNAYHRNPTNRSSANDPEPCQVGSVPDLLRFEANAEALASLLDSGPAVSADATQAARNVLNLDPKVQERHLVVILDGSETDPEAEAIQALCREKKVRLHCWRFPQSDRNGTKGEGGDANSGSLGARQAANGKASVVRGNRRFWEIDDDAAPAQQAVNLDGRGPGDDPSVRTASPDPRGAENPRGPENPRGTENGGPALPLFFRDEEQSALMWASFADSLRARYTLRARRTPTGVAVRVAGTSPARFSRRADLLREGRND